MCILYLRSSGTKSAGYLRLAMVNFHVVLPKGSQKVLRPLGPETVLRI